jgi:hypothetical protein
MRQIETVRSDVGEDVRPLRDDEMDAVCGAARAGGDRHEYMEIKLKEVFVTSV